MIEYFNEDCMEGMDKVKLLHGDCLELMKDIGNKKEQVNEKD